MNFENIVERLRAIEAPGFLEADLATRLEKPTDPAELKKWKLPKDARTGDDFVKVDPSHIAAFMEICRDDPELRLDLLADLSGVDPSADDEDLWVVYHLLSVTHHHRLMVKCSVPKDTAKIDSLAAVYPAANWHEREASEMFGITFEGHPDPRNMLLPHDWVGYPLRKDYEFPEEYHGISCV